MSLEIVTFKITGLSPLLQHNPSAMTSASKPKLGKKVIPTPEQEAEAGAYRDTDGTLYIPSIAFRAALLYACKGKRIGKFSAVGQVKATAFTVEPNCPLASANGAGAIRDYEIHTCRAVVQRNAVLRSRPMIRDWATTLRLEVDHDFVTNEQIAELLNLAGRLAGVGDFRPACSGSFGRFHAEIVGAEAAG